MSSVIAALRAALESEIDRVAKDTFGREYSKWNKEQKRPFNYDESFRHGHEAATERLMSIVEKAVEMAEFYAKNDSWLCSNDPQFGDLITADDYETNSNITKRKYVGGKKAREFLLALKGTK